jgi:hypothetical protein
MTRILNDREVATILHALRLFQDDRHKGDCEGCDHFAEVKPLANDEIDALCESINLDSLTLTSQ